MIPQVVLGQGDLRVGLQGTRPEGLAVFPGRRLGRGGLDENGNQQHHRRSPEPSPQRQIGRELLRRPGEHDIKPDVRQIRIAIGHRLHADLDQADDRQEGHQIPQPSDGQPSPVPQPHDQGRDRRQHEHGHRDIRPRHAMFRKRIERRQIDGVEDLADIRRVRHQGVFQPHAERDRVDDFHRPALGDQGHDARCDRQHEPAGPFPARSACAKVRTDCQSAAFPAGWLPAPPNGNRPSGQ